MQVKAQLSHAPIVSHELLECPAKEIRIIVLDQQRAIRQQQLPVLS